MVEGSGWQGGFARAASAGGGEAYLRIYIRRSPVKGKSADALIRESVDPLIRCSADALIRESADPVTGF